MLYQPSKYFYLHQTLYLYLIFLDRCPVSSLPWLMGQRHLYYQILTERLHLPLSRSLDKIRRWYSHCNRDDQTSFFIQCAILALRKISSTLSSSIRADFSFALKPFILSFLHCKLATANS